MNEPSPTSDEWHNYVGMCGIFADIACSPFGTVVGRFSWLVGINGSSTGSPCGCGIRHYCPAAHKFVQVRFRYSIDQVFAVKVTWPRVLSVILAALARLGACLEFRHKRSEALAKLPHYSRPIAPCTRSSCYRSLSLRDHRYISNLGSVSHHGPAVRNASKHW